MLKKYADILIIILFVPVYIALAIPVIVFTLEVFLMYPFIRVIAKRKPRPLQDAIGFAKTIYQL